MQDKLASMFGLVGMPLASLGDVNFRRYQHRDHSEIFPSMNRGYISKMRRIATDYGWLMALYTISSAIQSFPMVSFASVLSSDLNASASDLSFYYATVFIPWNFRAIYGLLSDVVPLFGSRRKLYIIGCYILTSCCILLFAIVVRHLSEAFVVGVFLNVFFAFSEAVLDALSIDLLRSRCSDSECDLTASTDLQSANMTFRTIGSVLSVATAGAVSVWLSPRTMIGVTASFPVVSAIICFWVDVDHRVRIRDEYDKSFTLHEKTKLFYSYLRACMTMRRWPTEMWDTIRPVLLPCLFVLLYASAPSSNVSYMKYLYTQLNFALYEYHLIAQCATVGGLVGTLAYWACFRKARNVRIGFILTVVISCLAASSRLLVVHKWNGIEFICVDELIVNTAARLTLMPIQVYASMIASAPESLMYEGFIFGIFASVENWGGTVSGFISGALSDHLSLSQLIIVASCTSLVPLLALSLVRIEWERHKTTELPTDLGSHA